MTHGSLFSGIGGFDLASEWMGWENIFHCEWNPFCQKVLKYHWPDAASFIDIKKTDFTKYANKIDILTGGFPCQPYSQAGKRLGKEDDRHLWPEMLRAIKEIQPCWVVGENVFGLINWSEGLVFDEVQADLEAEGYEVWPYVLPACSVNAPHRRDRVWFVAYSNNNRDSRKEWIQKRNQIQQSNKSNSLWQLAPYPYNPRANKPLRNHIEWKKKDKKWERKSGFKFRQNGGHRSFAHSYSRGKQKLFYERESLEEKNKRQKTRVYKHENLQRDWNKFPTSKPTICWGDDGIPRELDGISFPKWRVESVKAYGNAIVPQVAYQIFLAIESTINLKST